MSRIVIVLLCFAAVSCNSAKRIAYMQNAEHMATEEVAIYKGIVVQPKDILTIIVTGADAALVAPFNNPLYSYYAGSTNAPMTYSSRMLGYHVDIDGNIEFPFLGQLKVAGLTKEQVSEMIKQKLIQEGQLSTPAVQTDFQNFKISILGEVRTPGTINLANDNITIFEAISRAGDLTMFGRRDNVLVRRDQNGLITYYRLDLRTSEVVHSPAFYLQQNDVVYVEPNNTVGMRSMDLSPGVLVSLGSFLMSLTILIINLSK